MNALRIIWLRFLLWNVDMDLAMMHTQAERLTHDIAESNRRRGFLGLQLMNAEADRP